MRRNWWLSLTLAVAFALPDYDLAQAFPLNADTVGIAAPASEIIMARAVRGPRGGEDAPAAFCYAHPSAEGPGDHEKVRLPTHGG